MNSESQNFNYAPADTDTTVVAPDSVTTAYVAHTASPIQIHYNGAESSADNSYGFYNIPIAIGLPMAVVLAIAAMELSHHSPREVVKYLHESGRNIYNIATSVFKGSRRVL